MEGAGLHTGSKARITLKPAEKNTGIQFVRVDLPNKPAIKADVSNLLTENISIPRCTSVGISPQAVVHTVEHLMSVCSGLKISNLIVEIDNDEVPGLDGSGKEFLNAIQKAGVIEQDAPLKPFSVVEPLAVEQNGSSIFVFPSNDFRVSYTLVYDNHPFLKSQYFNIAVNSESYEKQIAPSRTFCLESEANQLREHGLGKGANHENTLVIGSKGVIDNTLRFDDEFARHKILDFIGDLYLLGVPIQGHVFAIRSGHALNKSLLKKMYSQKQELEKHGVIGEYQLEGTKEIGISEIMRILPHRYPFLLVDRVIEIEKGKRAVGIKNVTINDNFFQGHFPTRPIMPGVMMVEAMAQTAGVVVLTNEAHHDKVAFFMSLDKVKFRKVVVPGDQLVMEVDVIKDKAKFAQVRAQAKVLGEVVAEAEMVFSFTDRSYLA